MLCRSFLHWQHIATSLDTAGAEEDWIGVPVGVCAFAGQVKTLVVMEGPGFLVSRWSCMRLRSAV